MKSFGSGFNNFFVGLFSGLLLPIVIIMVLMFLTVDKITSFAENEAIAPLYTRGSQTLDKLDTLIETLDNKVDDADLQDIHLLAPLKEANLFPELKNIATAVNHIRNTPDADRQEMLAHLKGQLKASLQQKFPEETAQQLAENLSGIAEVLANKKAEFSEKKEEIAEKVEDAKQQMQETKEQVKDKVDELQVQDVQIEN